MRSQNVPIQVMRDTPRKRPAQHDRLPGSSATILLLLAFISAAAIGATVSPIVGVVLFGIGFIFAVVSWPVVAFVFIFGAAPFNWDVGGGPVNIAAADLALVLTLIAFLATHRFRRVRNPLWGPISVYFAVCLLSLIVNGVLDGTAASLVQMGVYMVVTVYVFSAGIVEPRQVYPALYALIASCIVLVGMLIIVRDNYAFGLHKNALGDAISMGVLAAAGLWMGETEKKRRRNIAIALSILIGGLLGTLSRGAWLGTMGGILVILTLRGEWKKSLKLAAIALPLIAIVWALLPSASKEYATAIGTDAHNTQTRIYSLEYCWQLFQRSPIVGVGPGLRKNYDATNVAMMVLSETGVLGMVTFFSIFAVFAFMAQRVSKRLDVRDPMLVLVTIGAALMTDKFIHGMVDHYWVRGMLPVWAGAGFVVYAYDRSRRRA